jgi:thioredoxin-like negative regulator of GroEL
MRPFTDAMGLPISTTSAQAAAHYATGARLLVARSTGARPALEAAIAADPTFALAVAALALCVLAGGDRDGALAVLERMPAPAHATRRERQHVEIVSEVVGGNGERAHALGQDHLGEFPGDELVARLLQARCGRG